MYYFIKNLQQIYQYFFFHRHDDSRIILCILRRYLPTILFGAYFDLCQCNTIIIQRNCLCISCPRMIQTDSKYYSTFKRSRCLGLIVIFFFCQADIRSTLKKHITVTSYNTIDFNCTNYKIHALTYNFAIVTTNGSRYFI